MLFLTKGFHILHPNLRQSFTSIVTYAPCVTRRIKMRKRAKLQKHGRWRGMAAGEMKYRFNMRGPRIGKFLTASRAACLPLEFEQWARGNASRRRRRRRREH